MCGAMVNGEVIREAWVDNGVDCNVVTMLLHFYYTLFNGEITKEAWDV
jgi:hypothetical protein